MPCIFLPNYVDNSLAVAASQRKGSEPLRWVAQTQLISWVFDRKAQASDRGMGEFFILFGWGSRSSHAQHLFLLFLPYVEKVTTSSALGTPPTSKKSWWTLFWSPLIFLVPFSVVSKTDSEFISCFKIFTHDPQQKAGQKTATIDMGKLQASYTPHFPGVAHGAGGKGLCSFLLLLQLSTQAVLLMVPQLPPPLGDTERTGSSFSSELLFSTVLGYLW